ncbi:MAG: PilN domain-containing protein [Gammaproteobacteria bacterium]|nr:PilN domain-containing protein [Gammaproteobacteria bacterium]
MATRTTLNLLPWREIRRKEMDRQLLSVLAFVSILMAALVFYAHLHVSGLIENQQMRNKYLTDEITKVDKQIAEIKELKQQRQALISRMNIIYQLQGARTQIVRVFDEFVRKLPEGVYFSSVVQKDKNFTLKGVAQSNARVSALMRNLDESNWFTQPILKIINVKKQNADRISEFDLTVVQTDKSAKELGAEEDAKPQTPQKGKR